MASSYINEMGTKALLETVDDVLDFDSHSDLDMNYAIEAFDRVKEMYAEARESMKDAYNILTEYMDGVVEDDRVADIMSNALEALGRGEVLRNE